MLAVDFFSRPSFSTPMRRTPLGARDTNSCARNPTPPMSMSSSETKPFTPRNLEPRKRESKYAPLTRRKDERDREMRRNAFLSKGREASEDKRFEARAEQNLRLQWLEEQKRWEAMKRAEMQRDADADADVDVDVEGAPTDEDAEAMDQSGEALPLPSPSDDDEAFEYYLLSQHEEEMDMGLPDLNQPHLSAQTNTQPMEFWSDDDEFEQSLLEAAMEIERAPDWSDQTNASRREDTEMMVD